LSEYSRRDIQRSLSLSPERVSITSAAAHERFTPISDPNRLAQLKARLGIERDYILFVGRTEDPRKNIHTLLDAYHGLRRARRITEQLVIAGRHGPGTLALQAKNEASGLHNDIFLPGAIADEDLPALMSGAQVFTYAPSFEGFGLPVLEALACGVPVITSNVTSLPEIAGDAAVYVSPGSSEEMEWALLMLLTQPALRQKMREQGFAAASRFSWKRTAAATLARFEQAATKRLY
jgi:glycosyltransferase involved in cell wall biosynthesis